MIYRQSTGRGSLRTLDPQLGAGSRVSNVRGHSDSFEPPERRISDGGDCRRRRCDRATRSHKCKLKRDTRNMICGAYGDRCTRAGPDRIDYGRPHACSSPGNQEKSASRLIYPAHTGSLCLHADAAGFFRKSVVDARYKRAIYAFAKLRAIGISANAFCFGIFYTDRRNSLNLLRLGDQRSSFSFCI